jgi:hypothetical protein
MVTGILKPGTVTLWSIALLGCAVFGVLLPGSMAHDAWLHSWDSAVYIETADNILHGHFFEHRAIFGLGSDINTPLASWPPMYPLLIALVAAFGVPTKTAAIVVSITAALVSLFLLTHIASRYLKWHVVAPLVIAIAASAAFQMYGSRSLSESTFLVFELASIACLIEWTQRDKPRLVWLFAAGVFAGATWATRNAGMAVFAASAVFFASHLAWRKFADVARLSAIWAAGAALVVVPWLIRNLVVFGKLNPYDMVPSDVSVWFALRKAVEVIVFDITTLLTASNIATNTVVLLATLVLALAGVVAFFVLRRPSLEAMRAFVRQHVGEILLAAYAVSYTALIVLARATYDINEISSRYMVEVEWIYLLFLAFAAAAVLRVATSNSPIRAVGLTVILSALALLQTGDRLNANASPPNTRAQSLHGLFGEHPCESLASSIRPDQFLFTDTAYLLRIHCDVRARATPGWQGTDFRNPPVTLADLEKAGEAGHLWGVILEDPAAADRGEYGPVFQELEQHPANHPEFRVETDLAPALELHYIPAAKR